VRVGRAIALGLAEAGFDVVVNYHGSAEAATEVAALVEGMGRRCLPVRADVASGLEVEALATAVQDRFGRLDLLVNNASVFRDIPLAEVDEEEWDQVMGVNLKGPFLTVRTLSELLTASGGNVVNLVDLGAFQPWLRYPHHAVSKAALLHLTRVQARALAPRVRVNAIAPGAVLVPDAATPEEREASRERSALKVLGSPEDVVRTVLFLDRSPFITGEVIVVDGGALLTGR
jgi:NAD(P)-dependent dehydrogenase (short-subunit alcohol dehydrogenase family)